MTRGVKSQAMPVKSGCQSRADCSRDLTRSKVECIHLHNKVKGHLFCLVCIPNTVLKGQSSP